MPRFAAAQGGDTTINSRWRFDSAMGLGTTAIDGNDITFGGNKQGAGVVASDRSRGIKFINTVLLDASEDTNGIDYHSEIDTQGVAAGHSSGYQCRQYVSGGGTTEAVRGFMCKFVIETGTTATDMKGFRYFDPDDDDTSFTPPRTSGGTITEQTAYWCETLNKATTNYAWFSEDGNVHRMGGEINVVDVANTAKVDVVRYGGTATDSGLLFLRKSNGTEATPTAVTSGDRVGTIAWNGRGTTSFRQAARIVVEAEETFTDTASGSRMDFLLTDPTNATALSVMRLRGDGYMEILDAQTDPTGALAGRIRLYSTSGELHVVDGAGNDSLLSPHNFTHLDQKDDLDWSYHSKNAEVGRGVAVNMADVIRAVEKISGEKLLHYFEV